MHLWTVVSSLVRMVGHASLIQQTDTSVDAKTVTQVHNVTSILVIAPVRLAEMAEAAFQAARVALFAHAQREFKERLASKTQGPVRLTHAQTTRIAPTMVNLTNVIVALAFLGRFVMKGIAAVKIPIAKTEGHAKKTRRIVLQSAVAFRVIRGLIVLKMLTSVPVPLAKMEACV